VANKLKIFITGINAELMRRFVPLIDLEKYEIYGLSRKNISISNVNIVIGDLLKPENWQNSLADIDIIIHAAAITHTNIEAEYFKINTTASKQLIDLANTYKVGQFVYISSRTAVPNSGGYGLSKLATETYLIQNHQNYIILKPSEIFGGTKSEGIENLISDSIHKKIVICPIQMKYPLYPTAIDDVVQLMAKFIFAEKYTNKTIILNGPKAYSFVDVVKLGNKISGNKSYILPIPRFVMYLIKIMLGIFPINVGLVPDQIDRLYCKKDTQILDFNFLDLEKYIKNLIAK
jgi:nucleoside-diphosphate-sugar epimerase